MRHVLITCCDMCWKEQRRNSSTNVTCLAREDQRLEEEQAISLSHGRALITRSVGMQGTYIFEASGTRSSCIKNHLNKICTPLSHSIAMLVTQSFLLISSHHCCGEVRFLLNLNLRSRLSVVSSHISRYTFHPVSAPNHPVASAAPISVG